MEEYIIVTGLSAIRATIDQTGRVTDSTGGLLTGLTIKQLRHVCNSHKWSFERVGEPESEPEPEVEPAPKRKAR
jgi:hypothetical protein